MTVVTVLGILSWNGNKVTAYPDLSDTDATVIVRAPGLSAEEVEMQITIPIERAMDSISGVISKRSRSGYGLAVIRLIFEEDANILDMRGLVFEQIEKLKLPAGSDYVLGPLTSSIGEIYKYVLDAPDSVSLTEQREIQDYIIIPALLKIRGIVEVSNFGGLMRQYQVIVNPVQLEKYGISTASIEEAIRANNENADGGNMSIGSSQLNITSAGRITKKEDIENIIVENRKGIPILIKDIASVELGEYPPTGLLGYYDRTDEKDVSNGIQGTVLLRKFEYAHATIAELEKLISELNRELPKGVKIRKMYSRDDYLSSVRMTFYRNFILSQFVLYALVFLFFRAWKKIVLFSYSVLFSYCFYLLMCNLPGMTVDLLSLQTFPPALCILPSLVFILSGKKEYYHSRNEMILLGVIFFTACFFMFQFDRIEGHLFDHFGRVYAILLLGSLLYGFFILPSLSGLKFFHDKDSSLETEIILSGVSWYNKAMDFLSGKKVTVLIVSFICIMIISSFSFLKGRNFFPALNEGSLWIRVFLSPGISLEAAKIYPEKIRENIASIPDVEQIVTQLGRNDNGTDPYGFNRMEIFVNLKRSVFTDSSKISDQISEILKTNFPGMAFSITQPIRDTLMENASGTSADIAIDIYAKTGIDRKFAEDTLEAVREHKELEETYIEQEGRQSVVKIRINREESARLGINVSDINDVLKTAIAGVPISYLYEDEKKFNIVMKYTKEIRSTTEALGKILIPGKSGQRIPLQRIADIRLEEGESVIYRENGERLYTVRATLKTRNISFITEKLTAKIREKHGDKSRYFNAGGQYGNLKRLESKLAETIPLLFMVLFIVLLVIYQMNLRYVILIFAGSIFSVSGSGITLLLFGSNWDTSSYAGLILSSGLGMFLPILVMNTLMEASGHNMDNYLIIKLNIFENIRIYTYFGSVSVSILSVFLFGAGPGADFASSLLAVIFGCFVFSVAYSSVFLPLLYVYTDPAEFHIPWREYLDKISSKIHR